MATWFFNFFDNEHEIARDVRNGYLDYLQAGLTGRAATRRLRSDFAEELADADHHEPIFWMALAVTQWEYGRLEPGVKAKALAALAAGGDAAAYPPERRKRRQAVLATARARLEGPPPAEKPIEVVEPPSPAPRGDRPWTAGQVVAFRRRSGRLALLLTEGVTWHTYMGQVPYFVVLRWSGVKAPSATRIRQLRAGRRLIGIYPNRRGSPVPWDLVQRLDLFLEPTGVAMIDRDGVFCERGFDECHWNELDSEL